MNTNFSISIKYYLYSNLFFILFSLLTLIFIFPKSASAAYDGGRLIDNAVFLDANSMSAQDIQSFLVARGSGLATRSFQLNCYGTTSPERQLYTSVGAPCDQIIPASNIINYASQIYGVNPRVVLATLQKEQSLITSPNPTDWQINQAMGYGCPTTGNCAGTSTFSYQVDSGTWVLRYHYERANRNMSWWSPSTSWTCGTEKNFYKPNLYPNQNVNFYDEDNVMYRTHFIANAATSSFYCYTPHAYNNPQGLYGRAPYGTIGRYYSGSYNFVYFYELWFGTTQTPNHAWSIVYSATYTDNTKSTGAPTDTMVSGQKVYVVMQIRNQGNLVWDNTTGAIRLGTSSPQGRMSGFCDNWIACTRPASAKETTIGPGQVATFEFNYTAPPITGTFIENFTPLIENSGWLSDNGLFLRTTVVPKQFSWQFISQGAYKDITRTQPADLTTMSPGEKTWLTLTVKNTGNVNWYNNPANGQVVNLGSAAPNDRRSALHNTDWPGFSRPATLKEAVVGPGQYGTFEFSFIAPNMAFNSMERFNLVAEGKEWMPDNGVGYFTKLSNVYSWAFAAQYAYTNSTKTTPVNLADLTAGQTVYIGFIAKNTGNTTWYKSGGYGVNATTSEPTDRLSSFTNASWFSANRPSQLVEPSVAPGQYGTFEFTYTAPAAKGEYREHFRPVVENIMHMNSTGMYFYTVVK